MDESPVRAGLLRDLGGAAGVRGPRLFTFAPDVNEDHASGGRVLTAPANGAAGSCPRCRTIPRASYPGPTRTGVVRFLLAADAVGALFKESAFQSESF
ncbi:L-serine ammonia-lyase, iron-sulfur-dependent, subunit alpha [Streptomyces sp. NPDC052236]|uniref:L-serine ammonia-lyase, iron-sulfur-dependent, subunit alpha n=1 Tax=Streptomyces sp. NPDC052236 TaxID=3365686 RepID=UPI0037D0982D